MKQSLKIEGITKSKARLEDYVIFDNSKIVDAILRAMGVEAYNTYDVTDISKKLSLSTSDLISILAHARIEVTNNCVSEEGILYLVDREVYKIKRYFEQSLANYTSLSDKEQRTFNAFLKRYGIKCRKIRRWEDLKIESIRNDCYKELTGDGIQTFYDGRYICHEEIESADESKSRSMIQLIRRSLMYNIKNKRKWIQFKPNSNTTVAYIITHHFHIFTSDDSNSIHAAKQSTMFNLPQNAKNYILAA
jgi:hypothetical protein